MTATTMGCGPGGILFVPMAEGAEALLSSAPKCQGKSCAALVENAAMSNAAEKKTSQKHGPTVSVSVAFDR